MALKVKISSFDQNLSTIYSNVGDYAYDASTGVLSLSAAGTGSVYVGATGVVALTGATVDLTQGATVVEIFPATTQFPGNADNSPSG